MCILQSPDSRSYYYEQANLKYQSENSCVYQAKELTFDRPVCLKILRYQNNGDIALNREVRCQIDLAKKCTNVPVVFDAWHDGNQHEFYIVSQWIPGKTMRDRMETLSALEFLGHMSTISAIMQIMFNDGKSHKDIKPENIMISQIESTPYLIDFNLSLTPPMLGIGTNNYRAPEMSDCGTTIDQRKVDMFSMGVMMYEFFSGICPSRGDHYSLSRYAQNRDCWESFKQPKEINKTIPDKLNDIIVKCMAYSPRDRYRSPKDLKRELDHIFFSTVRNWKRNT